MAIIQVQPDRIGAKSVPFPAGGHSSTGRLLESYHAPFDLLAERLGICTILVGLISSLASTVTSSMAL